MAKIKAVIFDVDGTLINAFENIAKAFELVLPQYGVKADRNKIRRSIGKTLIECYEELAPGGNHEDMVIRHRELENTPEMYQLIETYEGLVETLQALKKANRQTAVLTNRSRDSLKAIFSYLNIIDLFDVMITPQDISRHKPNPEGIEAIATKLSIKTDQIIVVGDTVTDILTGKNAGVLAKIGVSYGFGTKEDLRQAGADYIIDSLLELPKLLEKLEVK